jgi:predicted O-methyltransferase YrrM
VSEAERYASHLFVLRALLATLKPRRVLEFGSGLYSTPFFLRSRRLESLVSVEEDPEWAERVRVNGDKRLVVQPQFDGSLMDFDLVFIDNARAVEERAKTIRWVLSQEHPVVVIHDAETPEYARVVAELSPLPTTAIVSPS